MYIIQMLLRTMRFLGCGAARAPIRKGLPDSYLSDTQVVEGMQFNWSFYDSNDTRHFVHL